jgi:hypothetical protein
VFRAVVVKDPRSGFASDKDAGAGVPRLVPQHDAGIQPALGGPSEVDGRRPEHPHPLRGLGEPFGEAQAPAVLALRILPKGVLVDRDKGIGKRGCLAYAEALSAGTPGSTAV